MGRPEAGEPPDCLGLDTDGTSGKQSTCNVGDTGDVGSNPGSGRSCGGGHGNPLQYSCLENPTYRGAWQAALHAVTESDVNECLSLTLVI